MQIETLKDVLHWTREFHQHLSQCLSHCADKNTDERARMILAYLSDHEKSLTKVVNGFETSGDEHALNTWCMEGRAPGRGVRSHRARWQSEAWLHAAGR